MTPPTGLHRSFTMSSAALMAVTVVVLVMSLPSRQVAAAAHCPHDVEGATRHCLDEHHSFLQNIQQSETHFFAGIDAEYIRTLCHEFKSKSMHCVQVIQRSCPEARHRAIETALRPYGAFINMCYRQHFIEEYAMMQNCLYSRRSQTEICYRRFLTDAASHEYLAWQNQHSAIVPFCRSLSELTSCVQAKTRSCNDVGAQPKTNQLVAMLVSVSVELSFKCLDGASGTTATATSATHRANNNDVRKIPSSSSHESSVAITRRPSVSLVVQTVLLGLIVNQFRQRLIACWY